MMCGLAGVAGQTLGFTDLDAYRALLMVTALRGLDSTGVAAVYSHQDEKFEERHIKKAVCTAPTFIQADDLDKSKQGRMLWDISYDLFMGHCRDATVGRVTAKNAHPFETDKLIGAHNGTLKMKDYWSAGDETDSQLLFENISEHGLEDTLNALSSECAYALSIYEKNSGELTLVRNHRRSLAIGIHKRYNTLFYSSEVGMLDFISKRSGIDMEILSLKPYTVYTFDLMTLPKWTTKDLIDKEKEEPKTPGPFVGGGVGDNDVPWYNWYPDEDGADPAAVAKDWPVCPMCERAKPKLYNTTGHSQEVCEQCDSFLVYNMGSGPRPLDKDKETVH